MNIFENLTEQDKNSIVDYICSYAGDEAYSTNMSASLDYILRVWAKNKKHYFKMLNNQFILQKDIHFTRPLELVERDIQRNICNNYAFERNYQHFINALCGEWNWSERYNENNVLRNHLEQLMWTSNLSTNIYRGESFGVNAPNDKVIRITDGMKVSKALGKLAKAFNIQDFEEFRIAHSMCLNQKDMHGHLCISIHPLDFMTMSDNNSGWESCMSWQDDGSYRQGTVEMMNSSYIVMAYLAADEPMAINGKPWSDKKWRQLFVVTPNLIMGIKPYPYYSEECEGIVLKTLRELAQKNLGWGPYCPNSVLINNNTNNTFAEIDKASYINLYMNHMYNDITDGHHGYISNDFPDNYELNLSGMSECMSCGNEIDEDEADEALICENCDGGRHYCTNCGDRIYGDDYVAIDGEYYCSYCYNEYVACCDLCEEPVHVDNLTSVFLSHNGKNYGYSINICNDCLDNSDFIKMFGHTYIDNNVHSIYYSNYYVETDNLSKEGWDIFFGGDEEMIKEVKENIYMADIATVS